VKALFEYLRLSLRVQHDPTHVIELPKVGKGIPHVLMSRHEVEKLLALPDVATPMGVRDRAIMEVFYSSGLRLNELCHLKEEDLLFQEGMVRVMVPKGGPSKQRVVAIGRTACEWVRRYLDEARPVIVGKNKPEYLFINSEGGSLQKQNLVNVMRNYRLKAGFKKQITTHSFRVTCATEMLRNRADIRYVQAQLGHESLKSTQIYARVLPTDLKKVHQRTHPRERRRSSVIASEAKQSHL
jgi:integrase/recombinase XerD